MKKLSLFLSFFICMTLLMAFPVSANKTNGMNTKGTYNNMDVLPNVTPNVNTNVTPSMYPNNMNRMNNTLPNYENNQPYGVNDHYLHDNYVNRTNVDGKYTNGKYRNNALNTNNYRTNATTARTNNMSWGWLGLLGLIGLAGMRSRDRERS